MAILQVTINIAGKDNASKPFKAAEKAVSSLSDKVTAFSTAYIAFGQKMMSIMGGPIKAAAEAETALNRLVTSLKAAGKFSDGSVKNITGFAKSLQQASGMSDDLITSVVATNVQLGLTEDQALAVTQSAIGLAKATGKDLVQANQLLTNSLSGEAGELKKLIPQVGSMTRTQIAHGDAIELVSRKYNDFITSDIGTSAGVWTRVTDAVGDLTKSFGEAFLKGLDLGGRFDEIKKVLDLATAAVEKHQEKIVALGNWVGDVGLDFFRGLVTVFDGLATGIEKATDKVGAFFKKMKENYKPEWTDPDKMSQAELAKFWMTNEESQAGFVGPAAGLAGPSQVAVATPSGVKAPKRRSAGNTSNAAGEDRQARDARIQFEQQIQAEILAASTQGGNSIVAEHASRVQKIQDLERKAADKQIDIKAQSTRAQELLADNYSKKLMEQYEDERIAAAQNAGMTTKVIDLEYAKQVRLLKEKYDKEEILAEEYAKGVEEAKRRAAEAAKGTKGTAAADAQSAKTEGHLNKASQIVGSLQGGLNGIVSTIGGMFGPWGQLIAGIFQLLNQTPEQFKKMLADLHKQIMEAPKNIMANIPALIQHFFETLPEFLSQAVEHSVTMVPTILMNAIGTIIEMFPQLIGKVFSAGFWGNIANNIYKAMQSAFKNFFKVLFTGKGMVKAAEGANKIQQNVAKFGNDDPNAGGGEFKIKDAGLRQQRKAEQSFEESFGNTVEESGTSFTDMLKQAWDTVLKTVHEFFQRIFDGIKAAWQWVYDTLIKPWVDALREVWRWTYENLLKPVIDGLREVWRWTWENVVGPIVTGLTNAWNWVKTNIVDPFASGLTTVFTWFKTNVVDKLASGIQVVWDWFKTNILDKFTSGIQTVWNWFKLNILDKFKIPEMPEWMKSFGKFKIPDLPDWMKNFSSFKIPNLPQWMKDFSSFKIPSMPTWMKDFAAFKIPDMPKWIKNFAWPNVTNLGEVMGAGLWNKLIALDLGKMGSNMAAGLWNRAIGFDWKKLFGIGGSGGGDKEWYELNKGGYISRGMSNAAMAQSFIAAGALQFAQGGMVPGSGFRDSVPAVLTPGERVLTRREVAQGSGGANISFTFNIAANSGVTRDMLQKEIVPKVIDAIRRESRNGINVVSPNGVY